MSSPMIESPAKTLEMTEVSAIRRFKDALATVLVSLAVLVAMIPLVWVLYTVISRGFPHIVDATWWTESRVRGGAAHAIVASLQQAAVAAVISIPLGVFVAVYLVEYAGLSRLGKLTTFMVDILSGVPSIVAALFVYAVWNILFGFDRSGFGVALALVLLMLPVIVRSTEEMLKIVPQDLREASFALGIPKWKTIVRVVLPTALAGIVTGIMLSVARVMGESAPVLILVGAFQGFNYNLMEGAQESLPLMMVQLRSAGDTEIVWGAALTLIIMIAVLNLIASFISKKFSPKAV